MITEHQEEQASLYALGLLSAEEEAAFEAEMRQGQELRDLVASLNNATLALARSAPALALPASVREKFLATIQLARTTQQITPFPGRRPQAWLPWAAAACFALLFVWQALTTGRSLQTQSETLAARTREWQTSQQKLASAEEALKAQSQKLTVAESARAAMELQFNQAATKLAATETERTSLLARLTALEQKDFLAQAKIAVLGSLLKDRPKAVAVSLWDQDKQNGVLVVENLPVLAKGKDYQLWVIDPAINAPVSAGVFKVDAAGRMRLSFKPNQAVPSPGKFAVTEETEGGVQSPTMSKMVVIGGL